MEKKDVLKMYEDKIKSGEILKAEVTLVDFDEDSKDEVLSFKLDKVTAIIKKEDVDAKLTIDSLVNFVGREVEFKIKEVDKKKGIIFCSRKEAQLEVEEDILGRLEDGEEFDAQIINILNHGAYLDIHGVTGLLKNTDFAEDYTGVDEIYKLGNKIKVRMKKYTNTGNIAFEAVEKYVGENAMEFKDFKKGQAVVGVVRKIESYGAFVQVGKNIDALCVNEAGEIEEDQKVAIKITKIIPEKEFVRGRITKVLN